MTVPATKAQTGYGVVLQQGSGSPITYGTVAEITDIKGPNQKLDTADASHMQSPQAYKEYIAGLLEAGEVAIEGNNIFDTTQQALYTAMGTRALGFWKIVGPANFPFSFSFSAFVTEFNPQFPKDKPSTFSAKLKISGPVAWANS